MSERDELVEYLRICGACHGCGIGADGDTCANCGDQRQPNRRAASLLERDGAEIARWQQVWDNVQLDVPDLRDDNKPLAVACSYELTKRERDAARAEAEALRAFVDSRRESGWAIAAGKNAGPALNKALPDARAVLARLKEEGLT